MAGAENIDQLLAESTWVRALAQSLVGDEHAAEDLAQEAYLRALKHPPRSDGNVRAWFRTVLRRLATGSFHTRNQRVARERQAALHEHVESVEELVSRVDLQRRLALLATNLPEPYRETILLRYFEGLEPQDIAGRLQVPAATIRTRVRRGLEQLRQRLDHVHGERATWQAALLPLAYGGIDQAIEDPGLSVRSEAVRTGAAVSAGATGGSLAAKVAVMLLLVAGTAWWGITAIHSRPDGVQGKSTGGGRSLVAQDPSTIPGGIGPTLHATPTPEDPVDPAPVGAAAASTAASAEPPAAQPGSRARWSGRVLSSTGEVLPGISVEVERKPLGWTSRRTVATTGADGTFVMPAVTSSGAQLRFVGAGHQPGVFPLEELLPSAQKLDDGHLALPDTVLAAPVVIRGRVHDPEGRAIPDASVELWRVIPGLITTGPDQLRSEDDGTMLMETVSTDAAGQFHFAGFATEHYHVTCEAQGWAGRITQEFQQAPADEVVFVLMPCVPLTGSVHFEDGMPAHGAEVHIGTPGGGGDVTAKVDGAGRFSLPNPPPGPWMVVVDHPFAVTLHALNLSATPQLDFVLEVGGTIEIQVTGEEQLGEWGKWRLAFDGESLSYRYRYDRAQQLIAVPGVRPGVHRLQVSAERLASPWMEVVVHPRRVSTLEVTLEPLEPMSLRVVDRTGRPILGAVATVMHSNWMAGPRRRHVLADGVLDSVGTPGPLSLLVEADGHTPWYAVDAPLTPGKERVVQLDPDFEVVFEFRGLDGLQVDGLQVGCRSRDTDLWPWILHTVQLDADRRDPTPAGTRHRTRSISPSAFVFPPAWIIVDRRLVVRGLPRGRYIFGVSRGAHVLTEWPCTIDGPRVEVVDLEEPRQLCVQGIVTVNGAAVPHAMLAFHRPAPEFRTKARTDGAGCFEVEVPAGRYWISLHEAGATNRMDGLEVLRDLDAEHLELALVAVSAVVRFLDVEGRPLELRGGIYMQGLGHHLFRTDEEGRATFPQITPGTYQVFGKYGNSPLRFEKVVIPEQPQETIQVRQLPAD